MVSVLRRLLPRVLRYASDRCWQPAPASPSSALVGLVAVPAGWANVAATAAGDVLHRQPSLGAGKTGRRSLRAEVLPFTILSFTGLAVSTIAVSVVGAWALHQDWPATARTVLVLAINVGAYGSLWVLQFFLLDRVLFRSPPIGEAGPGDPAGLSLSAGSRWPAAAPSLRRLVAMGSMARAFRAPCHRAVLSLPAGEGVLASQHLLGLIDKGVIHAGDFTIPAENIQPASLDLRLDEVPTASSAASCPDRQTVEAKVKDYIIDEIPA